MTPLRLFAVLWVASLLTFAIGEAAWKRFEWWRVSEFSTVILGLAFILANIVALVVLICWAPSL